VRRACLAILLVCRAARVASAQPADVEPDAPVREGWTLELDAGGALLRVIESDGTARELWPWRLGVSIAGMDIGVGRFVDSHTAILLRFSAATTFESLESSNFIFADTTLAPTVQYWLDDLFFIEAGAGLAIAGGQQQDGTVSGTTVGVGGVGRFGIAPWRNSDAAWRVSVEATYAAFNDETRSRGIALLFGWQSF
jgi:hypothetical protein